MIDKQDTLENLELLNESLNAVSRRFQINKNDKSSSIETLCTEKDINVDFFVEILNIFSDSEYLPTQQLKTFPVQVIIDYLQKTHRFYLMTKLPEIENIIDNIQETGRNEGIMTYVKNYIIEFRKELSEHIREEERLLFPYIKKLEDSLHSATEVKELLGSFDILRFETDHDDHIENSISEVSKLIIKLCDDAKDILPFKILLSKLSLLEKDLRVHGLVENDILLPKAIDIEQVLTKRV